MLCVGLGGPRVGTGVGVVIGAGVGVGAGRVAVEDGVGPAAASAGVAGRLQLLPRCLRLLPLQLELHLKLLELRGRRARAELASRRAPHPGQLGQQL